MCESDNCILVTAKDGDKIIGFAVIVKNHERFMKEVITDLPVIKAALRKPAVIIQAIFGLLNNRPPSMPELQFIAVQENFRNRGIGRAMIKKLNVNQFIVGTKKCNKGSNNFYKKLNYEFIGTYTAFNDQLNYYLAK